MTRAALFCALLGACAPLTPTTARDAYARVEGACRAVDEARGLLCTLVPADPLCDQGDGGVPLPPAK